MTLQSFKVDSIDSWLAALSLSAEDKLKFEQRTGAWTKRRLALDYEVRACLARNLITSAAVRARLSSRKRAI